MEHVVFLCLEKLPWVENLTDESKTVTKMVKGGCRTFDKNQTALIHMLSTLEGRQAPYTGLLEIFDDSREMALAILI